MKSTTKKRHSARPSPDDRIMPFGIEMIGTFCLPDQFTLSNPIMPEGFITYTDLMQSSDFEG
jgi:hypothetical protein